jgi:hypothetical protein
MKPLDVSPEEIRLPGRQTGRSHPGNAQKSRPKNGASQNRPRATFRTPKQGQKTPSDVAPQKNLTSRYLPTNGQRFKPQLGANYTNKPRLHTPQWLPYQPVLTLGSTKSAPVLRTAIPWSKSSAAGPDHAPLDGPKMPHNSTGKNPEIV